MTTPMPAAPQTKPAKPALKTFACPNCGASVPIRTPGRSLVAVCESCRATMDVTDPTYQILATYHEKQRLTPKIPLGQRGRLKGEVWEMIGFVQRRDKASYATWEEYLLFNPRQGYRWLTCYNGHWNFVVSAKEAPQITTNWSGTRVQAKLYGHTYDRYHQGFAEVTYVLGEFYWRIKVGDTVAVVDYIDPPEMLSCETSADEQQWSVAEYIDYKSIEKGFVLTDPLPEPQGVAPNQPCSTAKHFWPILSLWGIFVCLLVLFEVGHIAFATQDKVYEAIHTYPTNAGEDHPGQLTTPSFTISRPQTNANVVFRTTVDNSWFYAAGELVNEKTGTIYPFDKTVEYYHGIEDNERWAEGGPTNHVLLSSLPGGKYHLNLELQGGDRNAGKKETQAFTLQVIQNVPTYANFLWALFILSIMPVWLLWQRYQHSVSRWSDSDFSPYGNNGDDDD